MAKTLFVHVGQCGVEVGLSCSALLGPEQPTLSVDSEPRVVSKISVGSEENSAVSTAPAAWDMDYSQPPLATPRAFSTALPTLPDPVSVRSSRDYARSIVHSLRGRGNCFALGWSGSAVPRRRARGHLSGADTGDGGGDDTFRPLFPGEAAGLTFSALSSGAPEYSRHQATEGGSDALHDAAVEAARRTCEALDGLSGIVVCHSLAGGTGSGLGSRLTRSLASEMAAPAVVSLVVSPLSSGETPTQWLNAALALDAAAADGSASDAVVLLHNDDYLARAASLSSKNTAPTSSSAPSAVSSNSRAPRATAAQSRSARSGGGPGRGRGGFETLNSLIAADLSSLLLPSAQGWPWGTSAPGAQAVSFSAAEFARAVRPVPGAPFASIGSAAPRGESGNTVAAPFDIKPNELSKLTRRAAERAARAGLETGSGPSYAVHAVHAAYIVARAMAPGSRGAGGAPSHARPRGRRRLSGSAAKSEEGERAAHSSSRARDAPGAAAAAGEGTLANEHPPPTGSGGAPSRRPSPPPHPRLPQPPPDRLGLGRDWRPWESLRAPLHVPRWCHSGDDWITVRTGSSPHPRVPAVTAVTNSGAAGVFAAKVAYKARALLDARAWTHWYNRYGVENDWIAAAVENLESISSTYKEISEQ